MTKLFFKYGTVNSGKSTQLLVNDHQYYSTHVDRTTILIKSSICDRNGIRSRVGLQKDANYIISPNDRIPVDEIIKSGASCIFVDEVQFLSSRHIHELADISLTIPVLCYGLRTTWKGELFDSISTLMAIADKIEEIKTICYMCDRKATQNLKVGGNSNIVETDSTAVYYPVCRACFKRGEWVE